MVRKIAFFLFIFISSISFAQDWPIYKGNIYFTGNNDEIIVPNSNLKWLFQADDIVYNPVVSDGKIYFIDRKAFLYCLDEEYGTLLWKIDITNISLQFKKLSRSAGKIKYPLIKGNLIFLSDPVAIYALDKRTGKVLWARTGMRTEQGQNVSLSGYKDLPVVDGIYADPVILENSIYYGTRNMFLAREIYSGHEKWENRDVKTYSGFPTFYDEYIFSQSMDFSKNTFSVYCIEAASGKIMWEKNIQKPEKIFPPVIYKQRVYIPSTTRLYCLDLKSGSLLWMKDYKQYITSNPSFTDRAILFAIDNSDIAIINPDNGNIDKIIKIKEKSSPHYVTVRDQVYVAYNGDGAVNRAYGHVSAVNFSDQSEIWHFQTPFPGAVSQPIASKGILFLPAGNYVYAIGAKGYPRVVQGGSGNIAQKDSGEIKPGDNLNLQNQNPVPEPVKELKTRKMGLTVTGDNNEPLKSVVEVKKYENGKLVYSKKQPVVNNEIEVPDGDNVEVLVTAKDYVPKKIEISKKDDNVKVKLDRIEKGKSIVVQNINFEFGKAYLKKESLNILDEFIIYMKQNPSQKIEVRGFTDNIGEEAYNQKLSERRADSVKDYLVKNGISPERINSVGFGEKNPISDNKTPEGRSKNRRTEFYFLEN